MANMQVNLVTFCKFSVCGTAWVHHYH